MTKSVPAGQAEHNRQTRDAYDRLAAVWAATTDDGPFNGLLERPALRSRVPAGRAGAVVVDAGCGSGTQAQWLLDQGAEVIGADLSPRMIEEARRRCQGRGRFVVADLAEHDRRSSSTPESGTFPVSRSRTSSPGRSSGDPCADGHARW